MNSDWPKALAPEHAPPPPSWWPPAPGWWLLGVGVLLLLGVLAWFWRRHRRLAPRRAALAELARIRATQTDAVATASAVQSLLRRYALAIFGAEAVARSSGTAWIEWLVRHGGAGFAGTSGQAFLAAVYGERSAATAMREAWLAAADGFVRKAHRHLSRHASEGAR
jgi:hypothetical protein